MTAITSTDGDALVAAALGARLGTAIQRAWCHQCHDLTAHRRDVLNRQGVRVASFIACPNHEETP
jgi:hypothetical protein